jgi:hypothetical protein
MEQNMKPITKQLVIAAFILALVTVASLGIRQVRFSVHRARTVESPVIAEAEPDHDPADSHTVDAELDPQYAYASESDKETPSDEHSEAYTDSGKDGKAVSMTKSFKGDYAKSKGSKGLEKISMGDNEDLYITGEGELWYVSKRPDGSIAKMQVHIDETTGEMTVVDISGGKSEGSQGLEKISMSDNEDLYITGEGELWYVSEQPDGSATKSQVLIDETTGEMIVIDSGNGGK